MPEPTVFGVEFDGKWNLSFVMSDGKEFPVRVPKAVADFLHDRLVGSLSPKGCDGEWRWTRVRHD